MSLQVTEAIECPRCGDVNPTTIWTSVNGELNPDLKQGLLDGSFFYRCCDRCQAKFRIEQPLLYHDMKKQTMVQLSLPGDPPPDLFAVRLLLSQNPGLIYKLRLVASPRDMAEKIAILDDGLDDRLVEGFKFALAEKLAGREVSFERIRYLRKSADVGSKAVFLIQGTDSDQEISVPFRKAYDDLRTAFRSALTKEAETLEWRVVDHRYFPRLLAAA